MARRSPAEPGPATRPARRPMYRLVRRPWTNRVAAGEQSWTLRPGDSGGHLLGPTGESIGVDLSGGPRGVLDQIRAAAPDALHVRTGHVTRITSAGGLRAWLPLYLTAEEPGPDLGRVTPELVDVTDEYDNDLSELQVDAHTDLMLHVNAEPWALVGGVTGPLAVPARRGVPGWDWAWWSWIETASMTSGYDTGSFGPVTQALGAFCEQRDEMGSTYGLFLLTDAAAEFATWVTNGPYVTELRSTWDNPRGVNPLAAGFRDLLDSTAQDSRFLGSDYADGDGIGLTDTSRWRIGLRLSPWRRRQFQNALSVALSTTN